MTKWRAWGMDSAFMIVGGEGIRERILGDIGFNI
jgi:hypothetical protein